MPDGARRRRIRILRRKIGGVLLPLFAPSVLKVLSRTWKVETVGEPNLREAMASPGRIGALWHGRMLLAMPEHANQGHRVLVSPSDDGSLVTALLGRFGYGTVRGSSNKNPARALREILVHLESGGTIVITPDGPRGPRHRVNPGPAWIARATGFPIIPCGFACDRAWRLRSWDRFTIPKFGARVVAVYGELLRVPPTARDDDLLQTTEEMRRRMMRAEEQGFEILGSRPDW
jgi:lysophospholipid acyltransferase (LPLAT)-like uncharacterized protein